MAVAEPGPRCSTSAPESTWCGRASTLHGRGGPTPTSRTLRKRRGTVDAVLCAAALGAGRRVSPCPINSRSGRRVSVNDAYLEPLRSRPGLTIRGDALVVVAGAAVTEYADEVVLGVGVIHSSAILMRSGVGPAGAGGRRRARRPPAHHRGGRPARHRHAPDDGSVVVDPSCRVLGVDGLCVVDASIGPSVPRADTNLASIMVGEFMADRLG
ncbi:GMC oxidoreductase [Actinoallomurus iriomotensis]|uniref:Glucose-methanol-choline oxidoreductase C-terminal domain-containing protein n=1 Tax=Actinoallomurus iriomotensis TaxID=478107 RepID=A0A9W6VYV1_9ACTN|nr:GMC oxidoreductase [Actinoallomurus iriomotensis]GLY85250.1 hypothetical protein Airi02_031790 [Actinoallomurus iriomotensis]